MTALPPVRPIHLNATREDFAGNDGKGRYLLLPGSRSRAQSIAARFVDASVKTHPRGHDLHLGRIEKDGKTLDVGTISTGMGCPSIDLIVTELLALGATTLLRVGTCGSLQPGIATGDLIVATAAVRDEGTSDHYLPREFPALASFALLRAANAAVSKAAARVHFGPVHTKDSLYARELKLGPLRRHHEEYEALLRSGGILASEMECAHLFVLAQLGERAEGASPRTAGAVLAVIGDHDQPFRESPLAGKAVEASIQLAIDTLFELSGPTTT